ncbi:MULTISPECIES: family 10 glycosylhydrolase [Bacillaceae]|uniref:family 10 glycosylhydrolase n=1 Tax=Bacillaceae TaxID=186817 RepID=UPI0029656A16|nr:family 10 glycosylhydrolase [Bacillus infantis]MDW2876493.1 family 10 glycosylhydrolase [Bacillus infantis]
MWKKRFSVFSVLILLFSMIPVFSASADYTEDDVIEVEAAPEDITIDPIGKMKQISFIDEDFEGKADFIGLYTSEYAKEILVKRLWVAVQVNDKNEVTKVVNPSAGGAVPVWEQEQTIEIPAGGYVLLAQDDSWATKDFRKFLAVNFTEGDVIKLRKNGEVVPITEFMTGEGLVPGIEVSNEPMYTVTEASTLVKGTIRNFEEGEDYSLMVNGQEAAIASDGSFQYEYPLSAKTNYIDLMISKNGTEYEKKSLVVFYKNYTEEDKEVFLWVDQAANARKFQSSESIRDMLVMAKDAGVTSIVFDVKGVEGFASYKKNDLTGRPYVSEMTAPSRAGSNPDLDLLEEFISHAHDLGLTVHASMNVFAEGSIAFDEYAVLNEHPEWEEKVYRHEDGGQILPLRESKYGKSGALVAFVNPADPEVVDYQLKSYEEVIKNYDVDGIVLDRGRYDNFFADFSDISRAQFEDFLAERGKQLTSWPEDVFTYEGSTRVDGPLIDEWFTYRASVIKDFTSQLRGLVDSYNGKRSKQVEISSYVGSWFDSYYLNGVNWSSPNFKYDERLQFPNDQIYTDDYAQFGYTEDLDFLMIGTYQDTAAEVKKYITLGNILMNGELPVYAGMALANHQEPALQREVFQAGLQNSAGLMIFDYSQANFPVIKASINDEEYVKDYELGISDPREGSEPIKGDFFNVNRNEDNINVYSDGFGLSTGTNKWGVEAVVDRTGKVTKMVNKEQAMNWSWGVANDNNSLIPEGGFVISAADASGVRERRQLVANAYSVGDDVRAALLSGFLEYDGKTFTKSKVEIKGKAEVIGAGAAAVKINGEEAAVQSNGAFSAAVPLQVGANQVTVEVFVDGMKTHHKVLELNRESSEDPLQEAMQLIEEQIDAGIRNSLLAQLRNAERHFERMEEFRERGDEKKALQEEKNGKKSVQKVIDQLEKHSGKHVDPDTAAEIIGLLEFLL